MPNSQNPHSPIKVSKQSWLWTFISVSIVITLFFTLFKVEGQPFQWKVDAKDWTGFGQSYDNDVLEVAEKGSETQGKITKKIDKITTTQKRLQPAKTLWDWMSLFLAPATLAGLGFWFQASQEQAKAVQAKAEKERDEDRQRDDAIENYINSISDLLVGKNLSILAKQKARGMLDTQKQDLVDALDVGMDLIRARTLSIFQRFTDDKDPNRTDGKRKGSVLLFLYETGLIGKQKKDEQGQEDTEPKLFQALLSLSGADLTRANLTHANLFRADLTHANLSNADLRGATLLYANLSRAKFIGADLSNARLHSAILNAADLSGATLRGTFLRGAGFHAAILSGADLRGAFITGADLSTATLKDTIFRGADFTNANLSAADLRGADFSAANLSGAILLGVDLSSVRPGTLTQEQLEGEKQPLLCKVKLPHDIEVDPDRDCKNLLEVLQERYPKQCSNLAVAQAYVQGYVGLWT